MPSTGSEAKLCRASKRRRVKGALATSLAVQTAQGCAAEERGFDQAAILADEQGDACPLRSLTAVLPLLLSQRVITAMQRGRSRSPARRRER